MFQLRFVSTNMTSSRVVSHYAEVQSNWPHATFHACRLVNKKIRPRSLSHICLCRMKPVKPFAEYMNSFV